MHNLSLLPLILVTTIGAVWASTLIFPNTTEFPRSPGWAGTISGALALFDPTDGSAKNTQKLNGITASGYLQDRDCSLGMVNKVWVGVDANGQGICGHLTTPLASIGKFTGLTAGVQLRHVDNSIINPIIGTTLVPWDVVVTNWGTATITFTDDLSVLRLDVATVVELSTGENTLGQSVAQAILSDGRLWGRILTSTGVNLGGGGMVAGVRGTSVSVEKNWSQYSTALLDSQTPTYAGTRITTGGAIVDTLLVAPYSSLGWVVTKTSLLTASPWARENMKRDIAYLQGLSQEWRVPWELTIATPTGVSEQDAICINYINQMDWRWWDNTVWCKPKWLIAYADYTQSTNMILGYAWWLISKSIANTCTDTANHTGVYSNLTGAASCHDVISATCDTNQVFISHAEKCQASMILEWWKTFTPTLLTPTITPSNGWATDCVFYNPDNPYTNDPYDIHVWLDSSNGGADLAISCANPGIQRLANTNTTLTSSPEGGVSITQTGQFISYNYPDLPSLAGKTITIEYSGTPTHNWILAYFWGTGVWPSIKYIVSSTGFTNNGTPSITNIIQLAWRVTFTLPATWINGFRIGSNSAGTSPALNVTIKKITIQ